MASGKKRGIIIGLLAALAGGGAYLWSRPAPVVTLVGVVRSTEIRIAPEVGGQIAVIKVEKSARVHRGDVVAELSALELNAAVGQARAQLAGAVASRDRVYAGVRAEQVAALAAEIGKAKSRLDEAEKQLARTAPLAESDFASQQALDQAQYEAASARADVAQAEANHAAAQAGPTQEERAIADAQVTAATAALAVLERRLEKTVLRAPADGVVSVIVGEVGEAVSAGRPVLAIEATGQRWLSFNAREDRLRGLAMGRTVNVAWAAASEPAAAVITEIQPIGTFATWQAERAVGDYDRNTLRLRLEPQSAALGLEPGMTVLLNR